MTAWRSDDQWLGRTGPRRTLTQTRDACPPHGIPRPNPDVHTARQTNGTVRDLPAPYDWAIEDTDAA